MRLLQIQVHAQHARQVEELARRHGAGGPAALIQGDTALVFATLPNDAVGAFTTAVAEDVKEASFVLLPVGVLSMETPLTEVSEDLRDVSRLSTLELVLSSMQSIGSWRGLLLFSVLAGTIGGYGLIFDVSYLLVAAMLINPMGAPALVAVTALAIGDSRMFGRGGLRFVVSLAVQAASALLLGFAYGLSVSTAMMEQVTSLSSWAVLVAFAAGAAGAQTQVKSDRDSLVSGTAAGFMVAAALAPPAAVLGLAVPLGRTDYMALMAFLLALQFLAIALGGWAVLRLFGVRPADPSVGRGTSSHRTLMLAGVVVATVAMVAWQATLEPRFQRADLSRTALEVARDAVEMSDGAYLIESQARFTRRDLERHDRDGLLFVITVENTSGEEDDVVRERVRRNIRDLVRQRMRDVVPFIDVTVVPAVHAADGNG
jgi:uncharacterized membrane protein